MLSSYSARGLRAVRVHKRMYSAAQGEAKQGASHVVIYVCPCVPTPRISDFVPMLTAECFQIPATSAAF